MLALLAEACQTAGQITEGLGAVDQALAIAHETGERYYEAELHRLKGELLLARREGANMDEVDAGYSNAEACFQRAITVARRQSAKSLELRAVMSLCRLWHSFRSPDKRAQAHEMLAEIYGWFTEGFDTAELKEAKMLLNKLA
jgi:predicted ATPase